MNNRGFPGPRPTTPGTGSGGSLLSGIGIGFLNDAIGETEARPNRPRPLKFPRIPYRPPPFRVPWGTNPWLRGAQLAFDMLPIHAWLPGGQQTWDQTLQGQGFQLCCGEPGDLGCFRVVHLPFNDFVGNDIDPPCSKQVGCGWTGQVPDGSASGVINVGYQGSGSSSRGLYTTVFFGDGTCNGEPVQRFTLEQKYAKVDRAPRAGGDPHFGDWNLERTKKPPLPMPDSKPVPLPPIRILPRIKDNPGRITGPRKRKRPRWHPHWDPPFRKPGLPPIGKDKKTEPSRWEKALWAIWSAASEVPDWVDAFWDAFPEWFQDKHYFAPGNLTVDRKVKLMLDNLHLMDIEVAIKNVLENLGEDALAGKIIGLLDSVGVGVGFNGVPFLKNQHTGMWN